MGKMDGITAAPSPGGSGHSKGPCVCDSLARSNRLVKAGCFCAPSRFTAGGLAFLSSTKPRPLSPAGLVYFFFSSCKNFMSMWVCSGFSALGFFPGFVLLLGGREDGRHHLHRAECHPHSYPHPHPGPNALFQQSLAQSSKPRWLC